MKFTAAYLLPALLSLASAAPLDSRQTSAIYPSAVSKFSPKSGAIERNVGAGRIFKAPNQPETTTFATFAVPADLAGRTCEFRFQLDDGSRGAVATGTKQFALYTGVAPAGQTSATWPAAAIRDSLNGVMQAVLGTETTWVSGTGRFAAPAGELLGVEFVGQGSEVEVAWTQGGGVGPVLICGINW